MLKSKTLCAPMAKTIASPSPAAPDFPCHQSPSRISDHGREGIEVRDQPENPLLDIERQAGAVGLGPDLLGADRVCVDHGQDDFEGAAPTPKTMPLSQSCAPCS